MGTSNTKALLLLVLTVVAVGEDIFKGGKVDPTKLGELLTIVPQVSPAIAGISQIPGELKDLDASEAADLVATVVTKLGIADAHAVLVINKALATAVAVKDLVESLKA